MDCREREALGLRPPGNDSRRLGKRGTEASAAKTRISLSIRVQPFPQLAIRSIVSSLPSLSLKSTAEEAPESLICWPGAQGLEAVEHVVDDIARRVGDLLDMQLDPRDVVGAGALDGGEVGDVARDEDRLGIALDELVDFGAVRGLAAVVVERLRQRCSQILSTVPPIRRLDVGCGFGRAGFARSRPSGIGVGRASDPAEAVRWGDGSALAGRIEPKMSFGGRPKEDSERWRRSAT